MNKEEFTDEFLQGILSRETERIDYKKHPFFPLLMSFLHGELDTDSSSVISVHLATCPVCSERIDRIRTEMNKLSRDLSAVLPNPLLQKWGMLHQLKRLLVSPRKETYVPRRPQARWVRGWAFAVALVLIALLGGGLSQHFRIARLYEEIALLRSREAQLMTRLEEAVSQLSEAMSSYQAELSTALTELGRSIEVALSPASDYLHLEGAIEESLIEVSVNKDLHGYLRIYERVRGELLFEGLVRKGSRIMKFGQSLEISWSQEDGKDAVTIKGWDKIKRTEEGWKKESEEREIKDIKQEEGRFFVIFPEKE